MSKKQKLNSMNSITSSVLHDKKSKNIITDSVSSLQPTKKSKKNILKLIKPYLIEDVSNLDHTISDNIIYYDKGSHLNLIKFRKQPSYKSNSQSNNQSNNRSKSKLKTK